MSKKIRLQVLAACLTLVFAGSLWATQPGEETNPNGFPSGEHYNLNILGKNADFVCPAPEVDEFGNPVYGNAIFIPENGQNIEIYMESGKGKQAAQVTQLQVTDPCAGFDGSPAVLQLPKNEAGYRVYARALGKPTDNPDMNIQPGLVAAVDEYGNDLVYLGLVTDSGFETPFASFTRKKGKSKAVDITGLFEWSGTVCYLSDTGLQDTVTKELCCIDTDYDGIYDLCQEPEMVENVSLCPEGYLPVTAYCKTYTDEWIFNIAELVTYLWAIDNNGLKHLQVRFYPN